MFVPLCKINGFSCVYEQKYVYLSLCYENGVLVLPVVYCLSNKNGHLRSVDLECRVTTTEQSICRDYVN